MEIEQIFIGIASAWLLIYIFNRIMDWKKARDAKRSHNLLDKIDEVKEEGTRKATEISSETRNIMLAALAAMGCPVEDKEDGSIRTNYRGEQLVMKFIGRYTSIMDPAWAQVDSKDSQFSNIQSAVNLANYDMAARVVMALPDSHGMVQIHSIDQVALSPHNPENNMLIRATLDGFFASHDAVRERLREIEAKKEASKSDCPTNDCKASQDSNQE